MGEARGQLTHAYKPPAEAEPPGLGFGHFLKYSLNQANQLVQAFWDKVGADKFAGRMSTAACRKPQANRR